MQRGELYDWNMDSGKSIDPLVLDGHADAYESKSTCGGGEEGLSEHLRSACTPR